MWAPCRSRAEEHFSLYERPKSRTVIEEIKCLFEPIRAGRLASSPRLLVRHAVVLFIPIYSRNAQVTSRHNKQHGEVTNKQTAEQTRRKKEADKPIEERRGIFDDRQSGPHGWNTFVRGALIFLLLFSPNVIGKLYLRTIATICVDIELLESSKFT